jgi:hypothetical protein
MQAAGHPAGSAGDGQHSPWLGSSSSCESPMQHGSGGSSQNSRYVCSAPGCLFGSMFCSSRCECSASTSLHGCLGQGIYAAPQLQQHATRILGCGMPVVCGGSCITLVPGCCMCTQHGGRCLSTCSCFISWYQVCYAVPLSCAGARAVFPCCLSRSPVRAA